MDEQQRGNFGRGWIPGERDIGLPGESEFLPGQGRGTSEAGGGAQAGCPDGEVGGSLRVPLHHPADGPPPPVGEDLARPALPSSRHNQWTREKMVVFLRELAATQSVGTAAKAVGMSRTAAYNLRNRLQGQPFALGWEVALELGLHHLAQAVVDRALNGEEIEHYYHGELVAASRRYDNRLAQWVLANPWQVGRHQVAREYSAGDFDMLLERVESASLRWEAGEALPGPGWPYEDDAEALDREGRFIGKESWYAADQALTERMKRVRGS